MSRSKTSIPKDLLELEKKRGKVKQISPLSVELVSTASSRSAASTSSSISNTGYRRNSASTIQRTDAYTNIENGLVPQTGASYNGGTTSDSPYNIHDAIELCQKSYYNISVCKNIIDLMTEFSSTDIYLKGGTKRSKTFFEEYFKSINIHKLQDEFFLEYYRSGNVFMYIHEGQISTENMKRLKKNFGLILSAIGNKIPVKFEILDPSCIQSDGNISFANNYYKKSISGYELSRLRNPKTEQDRMVLESLPEEIKNEIKKGKSGTFQDSSTVFMDLEEEKVVAIFNKKQPYEPFAVPMCWPVLRDINAKEELKKMDMATARNVQQMVLLITMGAELKDGTVTTDMEYMSQMRDLFKNQSVNKVLVSDYTTKAEFVVPKIEDILTESKYKILNEDIANGLNSILAGGEKFSNQSIKVKVFLERLKQGREVFKREFLIPQIKNISKKLGFRKYPEPYFQEVDFKDEVQMNRVYTRLIELGVLTADDGIKAIQTGELPTPEENLESQKEFKTNKDEGLFDPLIGGKNKTEGGRPSGTSSPKTPSPVSASEEKISISKLKETYKIASDIYKSIAEEISETNNLSRLGKKQKQIVRELTDNLIINEGLKGWRNKVSDYCSGNFSPNTSAERLEELHETMKEYDVDYVDASLILEVKKDSKTHE